MAAKYFRANPVEVLEQEDWVDFWRQVRKCDETVMDASINGKYLGNTNRRTVGQNESPGLEKSTKFGALRRDPLASLTQKAPRRLRHIPDADPRYVAAKIA